MALLTREIHHHRRLRHAHVLSLYEILATETSIYLVSELCCGGELFDYLVEKGRLSPRETRRLFGQLVLGVAHLHQHAGIVHRDLKLENILLDEHVNVKIADLGFGREFERNRLMDTWVGTIGYCAPELVAGRKYNGELVDIWSLGVILYALLTGSLPFDLATTSSDDDEEEGYFDDDEGALKARILKAEYPMPEWLHPDAQSLIAGILQLDPSRRLSLADILAHPFFTSPDVIRGGGSIAETTAPAPQRQGSAFSPTSGAAKHVPSPIIEEEYSPSRPQHTRLGSTERSPLRSRVSDSSVSSLEHLSPSHRRSATTTTDATTHESDEQQEVLSTPASTAAEDTATPVQRHRHHLAAHKLERNLSSSSSVPSLLNSPHLAAGGGVVSRTPSRTKRRSLSSLMSELVPPGVEPHDEEEQVDYRALLDAPHTAVLSSEREAQVVGDLAKLGFDVGQLRHSVETHACDASSALFWLLVKKAHDTEHANPFAPLELDEDVDDGHTMSLLPPTPALDHLDAGAEADDEVDDDAPSPLAKPRSSPAPEPVVASPPSPPRFSPRTRADTVVSPTLPVHEPRLTSSRSEPMLLHPSAVATAPKSSTATTATLPASKSASKLLERDVSTPPPPAQASTATSTANAGPTTTSRERSSSVSMLQRATSALSGQQQPAQPLAPPRMPSSSRSAAVPPKKPIKFFNIKSWFSDDRRKRKSASMGQSTTPSMSQQQQQQRGTSTPRHGSVAARGGAPPPRHTVPRASPGPRRTSSGNLVTLGSSGVALSRRSSANSGHRSYYSDSNTLSPIHSRTRRLSAGSRASASDAEPQLPSRSSSVRSHDGVVGATRGRTGAHHSKRASISSAGSRRSHSTTPSASPQVPFPYHHHYRIPSNQTVVRRLHSKQRRSRSAASSITSARSDDDASSFVSTDSDIANERTIIEEDERDVEALPERRRDDDEERASAERARALKKLSGELQKVSLDDTELPRSTSPVSSPSSSTIFTAHKVRHVFGAPHQGTSRSSAARPPLRDVFARNDDGEWVDEDDELSRYAGGVGQNTQATSPVDEGPRGLGLFEGRYSGVGDASAPAQQQQQQQSSGGSKRVPRGQTFKSAVAIEEEDEDEE